jgi:hypothetical protein
LITLPTFRPKSKTVDTQVKGYVKDKYGLASMEIGESVFHYGAKQNEVSPYCSYYRRRGRRFVTSKGEQDNRQGVTIMRLK